MHRDMRPAAGRHLQDQRQQMGFRLVAFAEFALGVGAGGVEVAQTRRLQSVGAVVVLQHLLDEPFAAAVGIDRLFRVCLVDRHVRRLAEDRGGGGEDEATDAVRAHAIEQGLRRGHVVAVVPGRIGHRFADLDEAGEMHHCRRLCFGQHGIDEGRIADVADMQWCAPRCVATAAGKIVRDGDFEACLPQALDHVRADVTGAADDEDGSGHAYPP
jgi:hypothetical protein